MARERKHHESSSSPIERVGAVIVAVSAFIGLPVALTQNRPASTLALAFLCLLGLVFGSYWLLTRRRKDQNLRFPNARRMLVGGWLLLIAAAITVMAVPRTRQFAVVDALGFGRTGVTIDAMRVLASKHLFDLVATVNNTTSTEQLVTRLGVGIATEMCPDGRNIGCEATPYDFRVGTALQISKGASGFSAATAQATESDLPGS